uniref:Uncharacterized protein n=1 Tax=Megaselia scalaris TaxID=36166 RepID=T1GNP1_MEGSC
MFKHKLLPGIPLKTSNVPILLKHNGRCKNLRYEKFDTLLCRMEALLNSRPLCPNPISHDQEPALSQFHFINQC